MRLPLPLIIELRLVGRLSRRTRYEQLVVRANALREDLHTEIDRMLNDVIKFKIHVQKNLDDYESFVTDELERELGTDDGSDTRKTDV